MSAPAGERRAWLAASLAAWVPFTLLAWRFRWLCDDGYISFRYARHLAAGQGLAFNPGEHPPVEGYSNLLWVLWLALGERVGLAATLLAPLTSLACGAALIALVARHAQRVWQLGALGVLASASFLGCLTPMGMWATGGLETMAFALALFGVYAGLEGAGPGRRTSPALVLSVVASALLRNDGPLWVALVAGACLPGAPRERRRAIRVGLAVAAAVLASQTLLRGLYHGDLLPHTARVKGALGALGLERGLRYLAATLLAVPALAAAPLLALPGLRGSSRAATLRALALCAGAAAYAVALGGDFLPMGRFLVPVLPLLALLAGGGLQQLERQGAHAAARAVLPAALALGLLPAFDVALTPRSWRAALDFRWSRQRYFDELESWHLARDRARDDELLGRALALHTRAGESLIRGAIGAVGYRTELTLFDRFGLVDREVARVAPPALRASPGHDRVVDPRFFLPRGPDYLEAFLVPSGAPSEAGVSPEFAELLAAGRARVEGFDLPAEEDFPAGAQLRLVRFLGARAPR